MHRAMARAPTEDSPSAVEFSRVEQPHHPSDSPPKPPGSSRTSTKLRRSVQSLVASKSPCKSRRPHASSKSKRWSRGARTLYEPELRPPSPQEPAPPLPCANGCGFFGSPSTGGLCFKCFRESLRRAEAHVPAASAQPDGAVLATSKEPEEEEEGPRRAEGKSKCAACGRKVGLMGFECRCGGVFCGAHRYSDRHGCGYDYRGAGRDATARANPAVRADKVDKL